MIDEYIESDLPTTHSREYILCPVEITCDKCEEVCRLQEWIIPLSKVSPTIELSLGYLVAVGQEDGILVTGFDAYMESTHHIRSVDGVGDTTESLRLTLCTIQSTREVEPLEMCIGLWIYLVLDMEHHLITIYPWYTEGVRVNYHICDVSLPCPQ